MTNEVFIISHPDDILQDGIRILCVSLTPEQQQLISDSLLKFNSSNQQIVVYVWSVGTPVEWLFDKKLKSDLIFFNANSDSETITGYLAAQAKSYYFGHLKDLQMINNRAIYCTEDVLTLLEKISKDYEQIQ